VKADSITERGWLYMDGTLINNNSNGDFSTTYSQCPVFATNLSGGQNWDLSGSHTATYGGSTIGPWPSSSSIYGI